MGNRWLQRGSSLCVHELVDHRLVDAEAQRQRGCALPGASSRDDLGLGFFGEFVRPLGRCAVVPEVLPCASVNDRADQRSAASEPLRQRQLLVTLRGQLAYQGHVFIAQFGKVIFLASWCAAVLDRIGHVAGACIPSKVQDVIVRWVAVTVAAFHSIWAWPDEHDQNESRQIEAFAVHADGNRSALWMRCAFTFSPSFRRYSVAATSPAAKQPPVFGDAISRRPRNRSDSDIHVGKRRHRIHADDSITDWLTFSTIAADRRVWL